MAEVTGRPETVGESVCQEGIEMNIEKIHIMLELSYISSIELSIMKHLIGLWIHETSAVAVIYCQL